MNIPRLEEPYRDPNPPELLAFGRHNMPPLSWYEPCVVCGTPVLTTVDPHLCIACQYKLAEGIRNLIPYQAVQCEAGGCRVANAKYVTYEDRYLCLSDNCWEVK